MLPEILIATGIVSAVSLVSVFFIRLKNDSPVLDAILNFAIGTLLAVTFLDVIPEVFSGAHETEATQYGLAFLAATVIFFITEKTLCWHHCTHPHESGSRHHVAWINMVGSGIHNFADGLAIAAGFSVSWETGIAATLAISAHELPKEIADFAVFIHAGFSKARAVLWNFGSGLTAIAGGTVGYFLTQTENITPYLVSIAGGSFLYLALADLTPEAHGKNDRLALHIIMLLLGAGLIYGVKQILPE